MPKIKHMSLGCRWKILVHEINCPGHYVTFFWINPISCTVDTYNQGDVEKRLVFNLYHARYYE